MRREIQGPTDAAARDVARQLEDGIAEGGTRGGRRAGQQLAQLLGSAAVAAGIKRVTDAASGLQQALGGTTAVFGEASTAVDEFAEGAAEAVGLSERLARETTSQIGALLKGFGFAAEDAADQAIELTRLGADLAATFGGTTAEAVNALGAALRGETDPIERFGISIRQAAVDAKAVELGLVEAGQAVGPYAKAQATLALALEQSADASGQFTRENDTAAVQAQIAGAKMEDAAANLGDAILPIYAQVAETVGTIAEAFDALPESAQTGILALAGLVAVSGPISNVVGLVRQLRPASVTSAASLASVGNAASNTADDFQNLYSGAQRGARGMRALATAGKGVAILGIAQVIADIADAATGASEPIEDLAEDIAAATDAELVSGFEAWMDDLHDVQLVADTVFRDIAESSFAGATAIRDAVAATGRDISALDEVLTDVAGSQAALAEQAAQDGPALERFGGSADTAAVGVENLKDSVPPGDLIRAFAESLGAAEQEADPLADALERNVSAMQTMFGLLSSVEEAEAAFRDVIRGALDAADQLPDTADIFQRRDAFQEVLIDARDRALQLAEALGREGVGGDEIARRVQELIGQTADLGDEFGLTDEEVHGLLDALGLLPEQTNLIVTSTIGEVIAEAERLERLLSGMTSGLVDTPFGIILSRPSPRAHGGPVDAGMPYVVGERRPELFIPSVDGTIVPQVPGALGGSGVIQYINGRPDDYDLMLAERAAVRAAAAVNQVARRLG